MGTTSCRLKKSAGCTHLVENSIIARYSGNLEKHECPRDLTITYTPLDTDDVRELLTALWGEHLAAEAIESVFENLTTDGAEEWPQARCEEDLEAERESRLSIIDHDVECAEAQVRKSKKALAELKAERDRLIDEQYRNRDQADYPRLTD
jgi:Glu-tRNA(Gln) amidotransferase subunit E-like FAD-binding protein